MTFGYREYEVVPTPGQPGSVIYRPVIPVRITGPAGKAVIHGLLDTGSDVTVLPAFVLGLIGAKYDGDEHARFQGVGGQTVKVHYSTVQMALDHATGLWQWPAKVGFLEGRNIAILGYAGFLEHFNTTFNTARHRVTLRTNKRFPGTAA